MEAEEFADDITRAWSLSRYSDARKLAFIIDNSSPKVRREIKQMEPAVQADPAALLAQLVATFGEQQQPHVLLERFYACRQLQGESIMDFSHRLSGLFSALQARERTTNGQQTPDVALRDQFARSLVDPVLVNTLRERIHNHQATTFREVREAAARWMEAEPLSAVAAVQRVNGVQQPQMDLMMEMLATTNKAIEALSAKVAELQVRTPANRFQGPPRRGGHQGGQRRPFICFSCGQEGHKASDAACPNKRPAVTPPQGN